MSEKMTSSVLIADDNDSLADNFAEILAEHGFEVATANSGPSALAMFDRRDWDLLLTELWMPAMAWSYWVRSILGM